MFKKHIRRKFFFIQFRSKILLIWTLLPNLTFYLIMRSYHRTFATGAACQQRTLTPLDTWSCLTFGLACVLMLIQISPELVLFPDFWVSNIPRYFSFALKEQDKSSDIEQQPPFGDCKYSNALLPKRVGEDTKPTGTSYNLHKVWCDAPDVRFGK